jgi:hypothetical protein
MSCGKLKAGSPTWEIRNTGDFSNWLPEIGICGYQPRLFCLGETPLVAACPPSQEKSNERYR